VNYTYKHVLHDEELRLLLEHGDSVIFEGPARDWQEIERQVDRLGFGGAYAVSRAKRLGLTRARAVTRVGPLRSCAFRGPARI
jgi:hypothetical protein